MKMYEAPQAKVVSFDNDYVMAANQNKSTQIGNACDWDGDNCPAGYNQKSSGS